jgi:predicted PurR-regulated permease PerM
MKRLFRVQRHSFAPWIIWAIGLSGLVVFYFLLPILPPFLAAAIIAYIAYPAVRWLKKHGLPATLAAILVLLALTLIVLALIVIIVPLFVQQFMALSAYLPALLHWLQVHIQPTLDHFSIDFALDIAHLKTWLADNSQTAKNALVNLASGIGNKGMALVTLIANGVLFPLILFYFLRDGGEFILRFAKGIPRRYINKVSEIVMDVDEVLGEFLRGELLVILIMSTFYSVGLWAVGLQSGLPIGIIAGVLVFVPYLGFSIGVLLSTMAALVQFDSLLQMWPVWAVFLGGQILEGNFLTPKLVGDRIGLHPVMVIFALLAFSQLFGFAGLLLALPLAAILQVGLTHFWRHYISSTLYQKQP